MRFFNRVTLQTPESVELEFTLAGIGNRAYALLIDYLVLGVIWIALIMAWTFLLFYVQLQDILANFIGNEESIALWLLAIQILIVFCVSVGYFVFFEVLWQGQTPGKRFIKIRVICDNGRPIRIQQATLRALLRPVDDFLFLGCFLIVFSKLEKRLGDWLGGTIVIQEERGIASVNLNFSEGAQTLANALQIEADISNLLPEDFAVIRAYLQRRKEMLPKAKAELSRKLAHQIKDIVMLEGVPQGVTSNLFLEAVYLAYQQQSQHL